MKLSHIKVIWKINTLWNTRRVVKTLDGPNMVAMLARRHWASAVSAAGPEFCILDSCSIHPNHQEPRVIIVGAGMAGLSAAHRLTQCGIRNFIILEAKERYTFFFLVE